MNETSISKCALIRQQLLAEPGCISPATQQHINTCEACRGLYAELIDTDYQLKKVLDVPVPAGLSDKILLAHGISERQASKRRNKLHHFAAMAASLVVGVIVFNILFKQPTTALDKIALQHVYNELHHLQDKHQLSLVQLNNVLEPLNVKFSTAAFPINYAGRCPISNRTGAHVVIQGKYAPVTLLFIQGKSIKQPLHRQDNRFQTVVLPLQKGNVAIIADKKESLEYYQKELSKQLVFHT